MEEDSTPAAQEDNSGGTGDDFDISAEDHSQDDSTGAAADSGDDDASSDDDNAPSDSDDQSGDDDKSKTDEDSGKEPAFDKDLDDWAVKHGHEAPETDKERKLLQTIRNGQRDFSAKQAAKKAADKVAIAATDAAKSTDDENDDPTAKRIDNLEANLAAESYRRQSSDYFAAQAEAGKPVPDAEAEAMASLLTEYKEKDGQLGVKFLLSNIPRWHQLAKLGISTDDADQKAEVDEAAQKAAQTERERIAKESKASGPTKSAKQTSTAKEKSELDKIWEDDKI